MKINEIIEIMRNKERNLVFLRGESVKQGNLEATAKLDIEIAETQAAVTTLQTVAA